MRLSPGYAILTGSYIFSLLQKTVMYFEKQWKMTFRPETNPKDSNNEKRYSTDGGNQNPQQLPTAKISTIYDPRLLCNHQSTPSTETRIPISESKQKYQQPLYNPKKNLIEKIKKISYTLHTAGSTPNSELDDAQKRMKLIKFVCLSILVACKIVVMFCIFVFMTRTGE